MKVVRLNMDSLALESGWDEHFAYSRPTTERSRDSRRGSRTGRTSPCNSAHGNLLRHSLMKITDDKKAKKIRFYRNGDRFFKGMVYAVSPERFRTFESLLANLTDSPVGDKNVLPNGVRHIFSMDGSRKISDLDELEEGESYICASTDVFRRAEYDNQPTPYWNTNSPRSKSREPTPRSDAFSTGRFSSPKQIVSDEHRDFIKPKLVTIVRNGAKPRKAVRVLLNRKTAHSFDQVLTDITDAIKLDSGAVKRIFTLDGRPVTTLADFFQEDSIFVAYGQERRSNDDFNLNDNEVKLVTPYRPRSTDPRVTLRSAKARGRTVGGSSVHSSYGNDSHAGTTPISPGESPVPPKSPKRAKAVSAPKYRTYNNIDGEDCLIGPPTLAQQYEIGKKIGEGNFAIVRECTDRRDNKRYALKIIEKEKCRGKEHMIQNEVAILRKVKHPNIIELKEEFNSHSELYLVMELVKGGDLFDAIAMSTKYTEKNACSMIFNLASALQYLHDLSIVHRDIKPENLLVCDHGDGSKSLKLGDFGLATDATETLFTVCGTPTYVAPEILAETGYGCKVDIWAAGVIMYILLCGFPPFTSSPVKRQSTGKAIVAAPVSAMALIVPADLCATNDQEELFDAILEGKYEFLSPYWDDISAAAKDLVSKMLAQDPEDRLSAEEVQEHVWISGEGVSDTDIHTQIAQELKSHFNRKPRPSVSSAGIRLVAATALDKASRYFEGRKQHLTLPDGKKSDAEEDEIF